jgi:hypothetical protein
MIKALVWIALAVAGAFIGAEVLGWSNRVHVLILRRAAAALPPSYSDRYLEEWLAELDQLPDAPLTRLGWAGSIWLHRRGLARSLGDRRASVRGRARELLLVSFTFEAVLVLATFVRLTSRSPTFARTRYLRPDGKHGHLWTLRTGRSTDGELRYLGVPIRYFCPMDYLPLQIRVFARDRLLIDFTITLEGLPQRPVGS